MRAVIIALICYALAYCQAVHFNLEMAFSSPHWMNTNGWEDMTWD